MVVAYNRHINRIKNDDFAYASAHIPRYPHMREMRGNSSYGKYVYSLLLSSPPLIIYSCRDRPNCSQLYILSASIFKWTKRLFCGSIKGMNVP